MRDYVPGKRWLIRKRVFWWSAIDPDEPVGTVDTYTTYRAWTRDRLIAKLRRLSDAPAPRWEEVRL